MTRIIGISSLVILLVIKGCIGTDILNIAVVDPVIRMVDFPLQLQIGDSYQLQYEYRNSLGNPAVTTVEWLSSDVQIAKVSATGLLMGLAAGEVIISVVTGNVSDRVSVIVTQDETIGTFNSRSGSLMGQAGYRISGAFLIDQQESKTLLTITNAQIDNTAPGPVYYLGNSKSTVANALRLGVARSGSVNYELPDNVSVNTYDLLIVWCDPFNVLLGYGEFEN
jgi:hypothetical protein